MRANYILQFLLYQPRVYAGLDHLVVELCRQAKEAGYTTVCIYCGSMEEQPRIAADIEAAGGILELVDNRERKMFGDMWRLYRKYRPKVVDVHFRMHLELFACILSVLFGAKHFTHVHSGLGSSIGEYRNQKGTIRRWLTGSYMWTVARMSKRVFAVSKVVESQYREWSLGTPSNLETLYLGTLLRKPKYTQEEARTLLNLPLEAKIVVNVSAIEKIKGLDIAIQAMSILKKTGRDFLFIHIGGLRADTEFNRQYAESLKKMAQACDVEDRVLWLGRRDDVQDILPLGDIYIHPSLTEGLACTVMEASVASLPLIATKAGGLPEICKEDVNGHLIPSESPQALADAIADVADNHLETYAHRAREYVFEHFDQVTQAQKLAGYYLV